LPYTNKANPVLWICSCLCICSNTRKPPVEVGALHSLFRWSYWSTHTKALHRFTGPICYILFQGRERVWGSSRCLLPDRTCGSIMLDRIRVPDFLHTGLYVSELPKMQPLAHEEVRALTVHIPVQGPRICDYMGAIPSNCEPVPIIHAYVDLNLQTLESAGLIVSRTSSTGSNVQLAAYPPTSTGVTATISIANYPLGKIPLPKAEGGGDDQPDHKASLGKIPLGNAEGGGNDQPDTKDALAAKVCERLSCVCCGSTRSREWSRSFY
jgi:hypothetical protein